MKRTRSVLSVPGHRESMHAKAAATAADAVILDLEDSVPLEEKENARGRAIRSLKALDWGGKTVLFRINALDTALGYRDLIEVAEAAGGRLDAVVVPKIENAGDVHCVDRLLNGIEAGRHPSRPMGIDASIETAAGLDRVREIAEASRRVCRLTFGIVDYQVSVGARLVSISGHGEDEEAVYPGHRWHFAMSRIVMAAKARGLAALDAPYGSFRDPEGLEKASALAVALGFDGKWVIHPDQIEVVNRVFSPSLEEIERAERVMAAYRKAQEEGLGAVSVDGRMVDGATIRLARRMLASSAGGQGKP
jgi:citrate lyase subunit beta/citryl-CoA lyase/malyl-CoA/(S)-citramalyl-CoA lyase